MKTHLWRAKYQYYEQSGGSGAGGVGMTADSSQALCWHQRRAVPNANSRLTDPEVLESLPVRLEGYESAKVGWRRAVEGRRRCIAACGFGAETASILSNGGTWRVRHGGRRRGRCG